ANGPLSVNKTNTSQTHIVDTAPGNMRDWVWQTATGEDGLPVIAMVRISGGKTSHDYYYVKWNGTEWVKTFLSNGGGHFHQTAGLEMCYSGGMAIDPDNTNIMYCSVPVEGVFGKVYEIIKYTMSDDGTEVVETEQITKHSRKNNVRPYVIGNSEGKNIRLTWMYGDYTDWIVSSSRPTAYGTAVHAEAPLPSMDVSIDDAVAEDDYSSIDGAFVSTKEIANIVEAELDGEFTVSADIYLDGDYEGTLLDLGVAELRVETWLTQYGATQSGDRARLILSLNGDDYFSSNVYGSSDCWRTYGRGTGGNYGVENYDEYINLTVTYDGDYVTVYRDGLVDIKAPYEGLILEDVTIGGFEGLADNVAVFDRVLNHDEIKTLADVNPEVEMPDAEGDVVISKKCVDVDGTVIKTETITLPAGADVYNFVPEATIKTDDAIYAYNYYEGVDNNYTVYYYKEKVYGENLISIDTLTRASDGAALGWEEVEGSTLDSSLTGTYVSPSTTGGGVAASTLRTFVPIEGGKTYYVSNVIYNTATSTQTDMNAVIASGDPVFGTFAGLVLYSDVDNGGVTGWTDGNSDATWVGTASSRRDGSYAPGYNRVEYVINTPAAAKTIFICYAAWGSTDLYYGDFVVREIKDAETTTVTFDGAETITNGTLALGEEGALPEGVIGYRVTNGDDVKFVGAGELEVQNGDVIETTDINISVVTGAQVRYGGGVDAEGKVSTGNGLRFIAQVDRSFVGEEVTGYGILISAEGSDDTIDIPAVKWQDGESQTIFTAAITDLVVGNYNRRFTATPYVTVQYEGGATAKIYAKDSITRSIYQVATGLLKNEDSDVVDGADTEYSTEDQGLYDVLNAYVNMVGVRLDMEEDGTFIARSEGKGAYTGDIFFDVESEKKSEGVYEITITPVASFANKVTIMSYWNEFVRINNNHSVVIEHISDSKINEDGSVTFTFTVPQN
ncbi:MAG: BNR-4 repeat-containing protein, partial [Clostridia bacterium]|nr:BNR-4 repeat-containing protein [Clostridia bacterium]